MAVKKVLNLFTHHHNQNKKQAQRDELKDEIICKYNSPIIRFKTNVSSEKNIF